MILNQISALKNRIGGGIQSAVQDVQKDDSWMGRAMRFVQANPTPIDYAKKFFKPTEQVRIRDFAREVPKAIPTMLQKTANKITPETILDYSIRPAARGATSLIKTFTGDKSVIQPTTIPEKVFYGKAPVGEIYQSGGQFLEDVGVKKPTSILGQAGVGLLGGTLATLDVFTGPGKKKIGEQIIKTTTKEGAELIAKKLGVQATKEFIDNVINTKTVQQADDLITSFKKPLLDKSNQVKPSLIQEAKKYKSAEEFEKAAKDIADKTLSKHGLSSDKISIVGSYAKGTATAKSDLDIIITPDKNISKFYKEFPYIWNDNEMQFQKNVRREIAENLKSVFGNKLDLHVELSIPKKGKPASQLTDIWNKSQPLQEGVEKISKKGILQVAREEKLAKDVYKNKEQTIKTGIENAVKKDKVLQRKAETAKKLEEVFKPIPKAKESIKNWLRNTYIGKAKAQKEALEFKIKEDATNIAKHEAGQNYEGRNIVESKFKELFKKAKEAGIEIKERQNYIPHIYKESPEQIKKAVSKALEAKGLSKEAIEDYLTGGELPAEIAKSLKMNPFFTRERVFDSYEIAKQYGLTPKYDNMKQLVGHYVEKMNDVIANQKLVDDLIESKQLTTKPSYGMKGVDLPNNEGLYFAQPKVAGYLNDFFRNEDALNPLQIGVKYAAKFSKGLQNLVLAGGFPKTNLNFFTFGHVVKSLTAGVGNVATLNLKGALTQFKALSNLVRSNFTKPSINWFNKRVSNGIMGKMANEEIDMSNVVGNFKETNRGFIDFFRKTEARKIIGEGYDRVLQEKTFNSFLPMQTTVIFEDTYKTAIKKGLSEIEASKLAGDTTKKFMGFVTDVKGKTTKETIDTVFFAPKFREGLINTYWNTLKSLSPTTWKNPAFSQNRKLAIGMGITFFGGYDYLNKKLNGHHIWENPIGKKTELMIPGKDGKIYYIPFMPSQSAFFRNIIEGGVAAVKGETKTAIQKAGSNLSMGVKLVTDVLGNKDYFGNEIYDPQEPGTQQLKDIAKYVGLNANHPYIKGVWNMVVNSNASKQKIYPTYEKITKLMDEGKREEATLIIKRLSEDDRNDYYELRRQKLKPMAQVMSEMMEVPLRFSSVGKIESQKYYKKLEDIEKELKSLPEEERTKRFQEIVTSLPEKERKSITYALSQEGISTKGISTSENVIKAREIVKLEPKERAKRLVEEIKKDPKFITQYKKALSEKDLSDEEKDLKNSSVADRVDMIKSKMERMSSEEKSKYRLELIKKGIITKEVLRQLL